MLHRGLEADHDLCSKVASLTAGTSRGRKGRRRERDGGRILSGTGRSASNLPSGKTRYDEGDQAEVA